MRRKGKNLQTGIAMLVAFGVWTVLIGTVDVRIIGETGRPIGFAAFNGWFHQLTGVHMELYTITDWMGLVPVLVCLLFGMVGLVQLVKRRSLRKADLDILLLGVYYILVIVGYLVFEMIPVNYRPVFIEGRLEASYPSSTTLLVLGVMPTLVFQAERRLRRERLKKGIRFLTVLFSAGMVLGRLICGVHWFTDVVGSVLLSTGLFAIYKGLVLLYCIEEK